MSDTCTQNSAATPENQAQDSAASAPSTTSTTTSTMMFTQDQLQQLIQGAVSSAVTAALAVRSEPTSKVKCPERPSIDLGASETRWDFFLSE